VAALCLAILVFSYLLTLAIALFCLWLPVLLFSSGSFTLGGFVLGCMGLIIGGTIIWSLIPRRDEFKVAGVEIDLALQPRLRALIEEIAARIHQRMPDKVYLIPDANAFVTERGGTLGYGGKRIMGLGLPLIANMSTAEFSAVLAHEFAHYYSGDTRLGPRVFQTRMAMARAIQSLGSGNAIVRLLSRFAVAALLYALVIGALVAYWKLFMRFTQLVSR
jgi:heat shock protein HtpX